MINPKLWDLVKVYSSVSIIGMDKNSGKTTTLDYLIKKSWNEKVLGLTSIGRDGEIEDRVTGTSKPRIYVRRGTLIGTSLQCLINCDITKEIIETTGINTAMGEVVIIKALSDGYVELSGPSISTYMKIITKELHRLGADTVFVDGAISRKSFGNPYISDALILATGASLGKNIKDVVSMTCDTVELLSLEALEDNEIIDLSLNIISSCKIGLIYKDKSIKKLDVATALDSSKLIIHELKSKPQYVVIKGIISDKLIDNIVKATDYFNETTFIVEDSTRLFLKHDTYSKFIKMGGKIKAIKEINLLAVTSNPTSPYGYSFKSEEFLSLLRERLRIPVFDVIGGK